MADTNKVKIDGIYYCIRNRKTDYAWDKSYVFGFVLYSNGIYLNLYASEFSDGNLDNSIRHALNVFEHEKYRVSKYESHWGYFIIEDSILLIQNHVDWAFCGPFLMTKKVFNFKMKIANDSTLIKFPKKNGLNECQIYHYYKISRKPDSTNLFMTNKRIHNKLERLYKKRHRNDKLKN